MKDKILILGAADLNNAWMFLNSGWPPEKLRVTELRSKKSLTKDYGNIFSRNLSCFEEKGMDIRFSYDATQLSEEELEEVKFIFFGSPYFEDKNAHRMLSLVFRSVDHAFSDSSLPLPVIGIALDCLGPDGLYNINERFNVFNIPNWNVTRLIDLTGHYKFSPSHPDDKGKQGLSEIISDNILMLIFSKSKRTPSFLSLTKKPFFISSKKESDHIHHYVNLAKIPVSSFQDYLAYLKETPLVNLHEIPIHLPTQAIDKTRKQYTNCFSQPSETHLLRPTHVMKQDRLFHQKTSWEEIWNNSKGGLSLQCLSTLQPNYKTTPN